MRLLLAALYFTRYPRDRPLLFALEASRRIVSGANLPTPGGARTRRKVPLGLLVRGPPAPIIGSELSVYLAWAPLLALIRQSAWKGSSANFPLTEF
jgi:hypothetical protein